VLQGFIDAVAARDATVPIDQVYSFDQIVAVHSKMKAGRASGKLVVTI
jgi:NADPH:quinone reductase-like Zn-dependent oxidoreductase